MLSHEKRQGTVIVILSGELDHAMADKIRPQIDEWLSDKKVVRLIFDLSGLNFMDSSGLGLILSRYRQMDRRGGTVAIRCDNRRVDRMFEMAGLYKIIKKLA